VPVLGLTLRRVIKPLAESSAQVQGAQGGGPAMRVMERRMEAPGQHVRAVDRAVACLEEDVHSFVSSRVRRRRFGSAETRYRCERTAQLLRRRRLQPYGRRGSALRSSIGCGSWRLRPQRSVGVPRPASGAASATLFAPMSCRLGLIGSDEGILLGARSSAGETPTNDFHYSVAGQ
jgi:hypothetical protein